MYLEKFSAAVKWQHIRLTTPGDFDLENNMPKSRTVAPIPKIEVIKNGPRWEVHWDYQEGEASQILSKQAGYLRGYINGALDILRIDPEQVCCASGMSGAVTPFIATRRVHSAGAILRRLAFRLQNCT
ncbi:MULTISPECIES: hypothetical protein [unclassified Pseudomonas]|uniref:hypothetical protein n=2 Tax=unclassified Pseudomonas TaxID=196821 RepID=UPI000C86CD90|nr:MULTISPECIES: hypothetical protein [unclassified Pseudomonas]PMV27245.1 hypothetical protein C1X17_00220 [Pseudomonas sp. FW305-3-2-15-C-TSA2]PMV32500.1 hypothetical protein C1X22_00220 [Pseudomonas sp. DP16D-L5]PMV49746.1 hypothetical protein C1X16_02180 [Pseudomonas sp. FW305-3-2-15-C-R2A1]PMV55138.1 hypothetical protein C1X18_00220 [Pseudomonas sp. FW305-3-2-15-C-LB1]PMV59665.1 hypothetical protein C1X19_00220 [Pseudomonas sp. GW460-4]PMV66365.1 hypothetical protein C1X20_00220 [Pseudom